MLEFPQVFRISNIQWRGSEPECFAAGTFAVGSGLLKFLRLRIRHLFAQHFSVISFTESQMLFRALKFTIWIVRHRLRTSLWQFSNQNLICLHFIVLNFFLNITEREKNI